VNPLAREVFSVAKPPQVITPEQQKVWHVMQVCMSMMEREIPNYDFGIFVFNKQTGLPEYLGNRDRQSVIRGVERWLISNTRKG
jgi:hypothetical protein